MWYNQRRVRHDSAARFVSTLLQTGSTRINGTEYLNSQVPSVITCQRVARHGYPPGDLLFALRAIHLVSRLRRRNRMCSSRVSGTAYRQGNGSTLYSPTEEKILCRSPFRSGLVSPIFAVPSKGKRKIHKKEKTAGCLLLVPSPGRRHHHWSQRHWHIHTSSIEYIHVKRNRQNCTKCPLNKNEPARRFAALILGCVEGRGFH